MRQIVLAAEIPDIGAAVEGMPMRICGTSTRGLSPAGEWPIEAAVVTGIAIALWKLARGNAFVEIRKW